MGDRPEFGLNRIVCPALSLEQFFALARELGIASVELRNDLPGGAVIDDLPPSKVVELANSHGVRILTINALQKFNLQSARERAERELAALISTAKAIGCRELVLCPNNDREDRRNSFERFRETVDALRAFSPRFTDAGLIGLVEPLGFPECSLRSKAEAIEAIRESGAGCYRIVYDTFHHAIGPDTTAMVEKTLDVSMIGLVHASGVEADEPAGGYRDEHRVLVTAVDRLHNREQLDALRRRGYRGAVSFEPFAASVQRLDRAALAAALRASMALLGG